MILGAAGAGLLMVAVCAGHRTEAPAEIAAWSAGSPRAVAQGNGSGGPSKAFLPILSRRDVGPLFGARWEVYRSGAVRDLAYDPTANVLWIATDAGLVRRSPSADDYTHFTRDDGLAADRVNGVAVDAGGNVWAATDGGVSRRAADGAWTSWATRDGAALGPVRSVAIAPGGDVLLGTAAGLMRLGADGAWRGPPLAAAAYVNDIAVNPAGVIAIRTPGGVSVQRADGQWLEVRVPFAGSSWQFANAISFDRQGNFWVGAWAGVARLTPAGEWTEFSHATNAPITQGDALAVDPAGAVWVGSDAVVARMSPDGTWRTWSTDDGLGAAWATAAIAVGPDGTAWVGSLLGVDTLAPGAARWAAWTLPALAHNEVNDIALAPDGAVWFATHAGASRLAADDRWQVYRPAPENGFKQPRWTVSCVAVDAAGTAWLGLSGGDGVRGGVSSRSADGRWRDWTPAGDLASDGFYDIAIDAAGNKWFATGMEGLHVLSPAGTWRVVVPARDRSIGFSHLTVDTDGNIWAGGYGGLATVRPDGSSQVWTDDENPLLGDVSSLAAGASGAVWVGVKEAVLVRRRDGTWTTYDARGGMPRIIGGIEAMAIDGAGNRWLSNSADALIHWADGTWSHFATRREVDAGQHPLLNTSAIAIDPRRGVWFGTADGAALSRWER